MRSPDPEAVRSALAAFVEKHWQPDLALSKWRSLLADHGWAAPSWPERWSGQDLPAWADDLVGAELVRLGAVGTPVGVGMGLAAPTILVHGPDSMRERYLRPILTGEERWCQLFSEPGAGSDLAGLTTTAVLDGDEWVVNGQKLWNTGADHADFGLLLARTDPSVPKHAGLSYFVLPMRQEGVLVRPLRQMNGYASFNEVFLSDARVARREVIGEAGGGWAVARTTLSYERRFGALRPPAHNSRRGRALDEARAEADRHFSTYRWYPQRAGRGDLVVDHARAASVNDDPLLRQGIAGLLSLQRASTWTAERARVRRTLGRTPGAEGSVGKLGASEVAREAAAVHSAIARAAGMLRGPDGPFGGVVAEVLVSVPAQSIAGGTDEIQKNILAERMLGLPRDPLPEKDLPFNRTRRNA